MNASIYCGFWIAQNTTVIQCYLSEFFASNKSQLHCNTKKKNPLVSWQKKWCFKLSEILKSASALCWRNHNEIYRFAEESAVSVAFYDFARSSSLDHAALFACNCNDRVFLKSFSFAYSFFDNIPHFISRVLCVRRNKFNRFGEEERKMVLFNRGNFSWFAFKITHHHHHHRV